MSNVRLISITPNANKPGQVTVVFGQERKNASPLSMILAAAQGIQSNSVATAVQSFTAEKAMEFFGTIAADYKAVPHNERPEITAFEAAVGSDLSIAITESLTPNPARPLQTPKQNPKTKVVLTKNGMPIYREGSLVLAGSVEDVDTLIQHDAQVAAAPVANAIEQLATAAV